MRFSEEIIAKARTLRDAGLPWEPQPGHYVFDEKSLVDRPSPFQPGVYFILNLPYFEGLIGGSEKFREVMTWLPTWHDARHALQEMGVNPSAIAEKLANTRAIERQSELMALYEMLENRLTRE